MRATEISPDEESRIVRLDAFAQSLASKRKDAVDGRAESGVEQEWLEDEEFYDGIDEANRKAVLGKAATLNSGLTSDAPKATTKSNIFVNITQPYVDMASARVADMLLPTDDMPFGIAPTPMPDIAKATNDQTMITAANGQQAPAGDIAKKMLEEAKESADLAEKQIWDWLIESQWHAEVRSVIEDSAKVGTAILKGPVPIRSKSKKMNRAEGGAVSLEIVEKTTPGSKRISYWNFYPDPACGESIHNGSYTWEKDHITARQLRDLKGSHHADGAPQYIDSQIEVVLKEGPQKKYETGNAVDQSENDKFEIWYFHGVADQKDLDAAGCDCEEGRQVPVIVTMVNDRVIKAAISTLDSGEFPYDVMVWQRRPNKWTGTGVSRQVRTPQRMLNAATRNMMDNAGLSSGPQIVMFRDIISPADGSWEITPRKFWYANSSEVQDVAKAITSITIPSMQVELMNIIKYAMEMAEKVTSMPLLMQGQQGSAPDTVGGMTMLQNNASTVLRRIAKIFDDVITEPHIRRYYEWLLLYGEDDKAKGDFQIDAKGSSALFERDAQSQAILQMGALVKDPAFGIDPKKWIVEALKGQKLDPKRFTYTDEETKQMQEQAAQNPQVDPRVAGQKEVAQIRAEATLKAAEINANASVEKTRVDTDRDAAYVKSQAERDQAQQEYLMQKLIIEREMKMLDYANSRNITLDKVKADLAKTAMTLKAQKEMSGANGKGPQVAQPLVEPVGRAPDGQAFQK